MGLCPTPHAKLKSSKLNHCCPTEAGKTQKLKTQAHPASAKLKTQNSPKLRSGPNCAAAGLVRPIFASAIADRIRSVPCDRVVRYQSTT